MMRVNLKIDKRNQARSGGEKTDFKKYFPDFGNFSRLVRASGARDEKRQKNEGQKNALPLRLDAVVDDSFVSQI